jgi:hypothetical protein
MKEIIFLLLCISLAGAASGETTITINGKTIRNSSDNIVIINNKMLVGGKADVTEGSGKTATENRNIGSFEKLQLDISANVTVTAGKIVRCVVTADDNILPLILTESVDNILRVSAKQSFSTRQKVKIDIEIPLLKSVEVNGSGDVEMTGVTKDKISLLISGSGDITAKGDVKELSANINGSGDLHASKLAAKKVTVTVDGSGDAYVQAIDSLKASVNGSGNIVYIGTPSDVQVVVKGSGDVTKK